MCSLENGGNTLQPHIAAGKFNHVSDGGGGEEASDEGERERCTVRLELQGCRFGAVATGRSPLSSVLLNERSVEDTSRQ